LGLAQQTNFALTTPTKIKLEKAAGYGVGALPAVLEATGQRRQCVKYTYPRHLESIETLEKFASEHVDAHGFIPPPVLDKIAAALDAVDRQTNMTIRYDKKFTSPEQQLFNVSISQIDGYKNNLVKLANGRTYMKDRFNHGKVTDFLVKVFDKEAKDIFAAMSSLRPDQANTLSEYIDKHAACLDGVGMAADELKVPEEAPVAHEHLGTNDVIDPVAGVPFIPTTEQEADEKDK